MKASLSVRIAKNCEEAAAIVRAQLDAHVQEVLDEKDRVTLEFLRTREQEILDFTAKHTRLGSMTIMGLLSKQEDIPAYGQLKQILSWEPVRISGAFPYPFGGRVETESSIPLLINVEAEFDVVFSVRMGFLFGLDNPIDPSTGAPSPPPEIEYQDVRKKVIRILSALGVVTLDNGTPASLELFEFPS